MENTHIKANITRHAHRYLREKVQSMFFVSTGSHTNQSENLPASTKEGKADDAFDVHYTELNHPEMGFSFSRVTGPLPGYLKLSCSPSSFEMQQ